MQEEQSDMLDTPAAVQQPLSGAALLAAWESGAGEPPPARALILLQAGFAALTGQEAAALRLAQRDQALVALHTGNFGSSLSATVVCESCGDRLEFALPAMQVAASLGLADVESRLTQDGATVRLRLANTRDLMDAAAAPDLETARLLLLERCATAWDAEGDAMALPQSLHEAGLDRLDAMHEAAEISVTLACPACAARQLVHLDIAGFLWAEISHAARRLLDVVHELAWAYGWPEDAILAMSAARRAACIERARG